MRYSDVSVVMISRNEEKSVKKVILNIRTYLPGSEIILVDSSEDKTPLIAKKLGVKVIRQFPPKGYGPAMIRALTCPKRAIIATVDCDNTYPAETLPVLIHKIKEGYDLVGTTRISDGKPRHMEWLNYIANKFLNLLASLVYFKSVQDIETGMRAYKRELIHAIRWGADGYVIPGLKFIKSGEKGHSFPVELLLKPINLGYRYTEIPIVYRKRMGITKMQKLNSALWCILRIVNSRFTNDKNKPSQ